MGLFIAKTLTEAQNGRIWVDTEVGAGSTYNVLIPIGRKAPVDVNAEV
jgi:signal transduction histidine kinase